MRFITHSLFPLIFISKLIQLYISLLSAFCLRTSLVLPHRVLPGLVGNFYSTVMTSSSKRKCALSPCSELREDRLWIHRLKSNYSYWPQWNPIKTFFWFKEVISNDQVSNTPIPKLQVGHLHMSLLLHQQRRVSQRKGNNDLDWYALFKKS